MSANKYQIKLVAGEHYILPAFNLRFKKDSLVETGQDVVDYLKKNKLETKFEILEASQQLSKAEQERIARAEKALVTLQGKMTSENEDAAQKLIDAVKDEAGKERLQSAFAEIIKPKEF